MNQRGDDTGVSEPAALVAAGVYLPDGRGGPGVYREVELEAACWSARQQIIDTGADPTRFESLLLRGLDLAGHDTGDGLTEDALRERRHFSRLLSAMTQANPDLAPHVHTAMARHGIHPGLSNHDLS